MSDKTTITVALYLSKYGTETANRCGCWIDEDTSYVRVTEPIDIEFTRLPDEQITSARVETIDAEITKTRAELQRKIDDLTDEKNRLLAITDQS